MILKQQNLSIHFTVNSFPHLTVRYMKRRCVFLDTLPAFNYNTGSAEYLINECGVKIPTDTKHLGSTLMYTMLNEVSDFCDPTIKENWSLKPHQQVWALAPPSSSL